MKTIIIISLALGAFWLLFRKSNKKISKNNNYGDAHEMANQAIKEGRKQWTGIAVNRIQEDDEAYKIISNKSNIYEIPKAIDFSTYKFPSLDNKEIKEFIDWAKSKKSKNQKQNLFNIFKEYSQEANEFSQPRFEVFPPELTINLDIDGKSNGGFFCDDFEVYGFQINNYQITSEVCLDCEELSLVLSNPNLFDWLKYLIKHDEITELEEYQSATDYGNRSYYLKDDCSEFIPINGEADEYFDFEPMVDYDRPVKVNLTEGISYKEKVFIINDEEFTFLNKDKDHLVTLLNASYLPNIITLISSFSKT
jgi:hypothetical protein